MAMTSNAFWKLSFWGGLTVTVWLSLVPVDQLPSAFNFWDKAQHALGFAALAFTGLLGYPRHLRVLLPGLMLLGLGIEYAQYLTGWRQGDWADWLADCAGIALGCLIWKTVTSVLKTPP
jgi:hypothetical protein